MLIFLLAVVFALGALAIAGDQKTKQGPQGAFTEAVYSCAKQETNSSGQTVFVAPDRIPDGLFTYDVSTKDFIGGAISLPRVDSIPAGSDLPDGGRPGWYFRSAPLCNRDASAGTTDSLWLSTFTVDPLQTPESMPVSFSPPFRAGARGPQGPQGLYPIYAYAQQTAGQTVSRGQLPTEWAIDLTTGEISGLNGHWAPNPFQVNANAVLWTTFTIVNPAQWPGLANIDETNTCTDSTSATTCETTQTRYWSTPIQWSGTPGAAGAPGSSGIQGVTAGTGLSGGGSSGVVTLDIETPYTPDEQNKLAGIEDEATRVEANPIVGTSQVSSTNLNLLEVSGQYYNLPAGEQGKQGRYRIEIYGEAPANSPLTAPIGGQVNVQTAQVTAPPDTAVQILGSAWSVELFPLADPVNNVLWISTYWVNPQFQSGVLTPNWSTPVVSGELGPQGLQGEVGLSVQPMFLETATQPTKPDIAYASNHTFTSTPTGWNVNPPPTPSDPIWLILVRHQVGVFTASIDPNLITTPIKVSGTDGQEGDSGWSPQFAIVADGDRRVLQITGWTGGTGTAPASGLYVGATALVSSLADGVDIRGPSGAGNEREILLDELDDATGRNLRVTQTNFAQFDSSHQGYFSFRPITEADLGKDLLWYGKFDVIGGTNDGTLLEDRIWHVRIPVEVYLQMGIVTPASVDPIDNVFMKSTSRIGIDFISRNEQSTIYVARISQETVDGETFDRIAVSIAKRVNVTGNVYRVTAFKTAIVLR
ncbi:MAG: hypothetical protein OXE17_00600 [Chloroflexi bacterium]|nr:hypothetical protein [Chloroflexota bacterium]